MGPEIGTPPLLQVGSGRGPGVDFSSILLGRTAPPAAAPRGGGRRGPSYRITTNEISNPGPRPDPNGSSIKPEPQVTNREYACCRNECEAGYVMIRQQGWPGHSAARQSVANLVSKNPAMDSPGPSQGIINRRGMRPEGPNTIDHRSCSARGTVSMYTSSKHGRPTCDVCNLQRGL